MLDEAHHMLAGSGGPAAAAIPRELGETLLITVHPEGRTNLKAHNLILFSHLAEGTDEETWTYHLHRGDYSRWFRHSIRDTQLADEAERIEQRNDLAPSHTRLLIRELIQARHTPPA